MQTCVIQILQKRILYIEYSYNCKYTLKEVIIGIV